METVGLVACVLYVLLGVLFFLPLFFLRALYKTYREFDWETFLDDLPHWRVYAGMTALVIFFWYIIISLCI